MNSTEQLYFGLPKETRLHDDVMPVLADVFHFKENDFGVLQSQNPELGNLGQRVRFVRRRMSDIIRALDDKGVDNSYIGGVLSDERAAEAALAAEKEGKSHFGKRVCGIQIEGARNPISQLKFLVREEDLASICDDNIFASTDLQNGPTVCISSFPHIAHSVVGSHVSVAERDGQIESIFRTGEVPNARAILDLVSSGKTAAQYKLVPAGQPVLTAYPSVWRPGVPSAKLQSVEKDFYDFFLEKLRSMKGIRLPQFDGTFIDQV